MKSILGQLSSYFTEALVKMMGEPGREVDPLIRVAGDDRFGDYQSNVAMSLAKRLRSKPHAVATRLVAAMPDALVAMCEPLEIASPGFINIRLRQEWLSDRLNAIPAETADDHLGIEPVESPQRVVVDYSGPNVAKQMHVGHIRSTIIGDTFARVLDFQGHDVIRQNHIGDWGTQFGMLCAYLKEAMPDALDTPGEVHLADLEGFYRQANERDRQDPEFHERARREVVALHKGEEATLKAWRYIVDESRNHYMPLYRRLNVSLTRDDERGESFYADRLVDVVSCFESQGRFEAPAAAGSGLVLKVEPSQGALCIFFENRAGEPLFVGPEGNPQPMIIRKSDGAYLYATTDLAALKFRIEELEARRIIYVTDARQAQHFEMVFTVAEIAGWTRRPAGEPVRLEHVTFGSILGPDRKPLKTRSGENIKLNDLLAEAVSRAEALIRSNEADESKKRGFNEQEIKQIAEAVGIGAIKYADLSQNRQSDYVFSWDKMLAMDGNTAPYLMYAYARIRSIYRKGAEQAGSVDQIEHGTITLDDPAERALGRQILRFADTIEAVTAGLKINQLTEYLYELSGLFMRFYEQCPVLRAENPRQRDSRLSLCDLTARTLRVGLGLLGIKVVERM